MILEAIIGLHAPTHTKQSIGDVDRNNLQRSILIM